MLKKDSRNLRDILNQDCYILYTTLSSSPELINKSISEHPDLFKSIVENEPLTILHNIEIIGELIDEISLKHPEVYNIIYIFNR